jgi:hypothetical protein
VSFVFFKKKKNAKNAKSMGVWSNRTITSLSFSSYSCLLQSSVFLPFFQKKTVEQKNEVFFSKKTSFFKRGRVNF